MGEILHTWSKVCEFHSQHSGFASYLFQYQQRTWQFQPLRVSILLSIRSASSYFSVSSCQQLQTPYQQAVTARKSQSIPTWNCSSCQNWIFFSLHELDVTVGSGLSFLPIKSWPTSFAPAFCSFGTTHIFVCLYATYERDKTMKYHFLFYSQVKMSIATGTSRLVFYHPAHSMQHSFSLSVLKPPMQTFSTQCSGVLTKTLGRLAESCRPHSMQRVLGLTWRPRRMSFFVDHKPEEISINDGNTI